MIDQIPIFAMEDIFEFYINEISVLYNDITDLIYLCSLTFDLPEVNIENYFVIQQMSD